ncbi:molecular chaperone HtpG [Bacteroidetes/Chlorobi group bacterium ChocPot_Mid]|jgi:molecular chaperone HtpG|nr:MAG: molecular chaperone HtpG [Bacteroidetes/Chlorobi group bacterium ChocPot_Mid]
MELKNNEFEFKAEMKQLLNLIVHSLYTNPEIFLRELVSNSSDALNKIRFRRLTDNNMIDPDSELTIKIEVDKDKKTFTIEDTGIGMTKDDLINRIGTVASSGTLEFLRNLKAGENADKKLDLELIGQFGVGFYSAFMVTDEITLETLYADVDSKAYKWISKGEEKFIIDDSEKKSRGTKIYFTFKDDFKHFADAETIKSILHKYSNFVDFPIYVNGEEINKVKPIWQRKKEDIKEEEINEFYKYISNDFQEPLGHLYFSIEGNVNFKAMLFIPQTSPPTIFSDMMNKSLQLYSKRIFIQDDCLELLPDYLRFLKGVVDTEDLPLNVSREVTQSSPVVAKIRNVIVGKVLNLLEDWAKNDKDKYEKFHKTWSSLFKTGINTDFTNKNRIIELARYETSGLEKGKFKSLKEYVETMQSDQKEIYYLMGDSRELIEKNPNLEYFNKKGIEVIYLYDPVDVFTFPYIHNYEGKNIKSIDKVDLEISKDEDVGKDALNEEQSKPFIEFIKSRLSDKVEDVVESKRLVESPVSLVSGANALDPQMEKMMQYFDKDFTKSKKILEVNTAHPLIKNLHSLYEKDKGDENLINSIELLYESSTLIDGHLENPADYVKRIFKMIERLSS